MKRSLLPAITLIVIAIIAAAIVHRNSKTPRTVYSASDSDRALNFFIDRVTLQVKATVVDYEKLGLGGGVDGFVLRITFPQILPIDFINVLATGGDYSV
jgi:hypothetical protein